MITFDFILVGCGLFNSVLAERIANKLKKNVLIIEKRNHIGGNCFSEIDKNSGIEYHKYGTHIFHTSIVRVKNYINQFTKFNSYRHQVLSSHKNKIYQLPFNLETINSFYNKSFSPEEAKVFLKKQIQKNKFKYPKNLEEKAINMVGKNLFNAFVKNYTLKQWGKDPKNLPSSIINRIPVRYSYNEDYFNHCDLQGIPLDGYTNLFKNLLDNKKIKIILKKDFFKLRSNYNSKYFTIYSGPLDRYFNYKYGKLEWRSLGFEKKILDKQDFQGTSVINFPDLDKKFTRIHEPKHLHSERKKIFAKNKTLIIKEFPIKDDNNPYYPINTIENRAIHKKYKNLVKTQKKLLIGGRLADYAYYDMDMTISAALKLFDKIDKNIN
ncbi:MAG: UDP-galactopyranose mutase [Acidimicrobiaceae bacterium]|nr:UDP-galactopyranose mutase [Acidimicrobiaceae bacterium]|tara:strand:- start:14399 stop:15538 length:1140 start_codon:yes stop_codon:yes gene_type:complete